MTTFRSKPALPLTGMVLVLTGCSRAPSFDVLGSFFPAWMLCLLLGVVLTGICRWVLVKARVPLAVPILIYPSLSALFTFTLWLLFFQ